MPDKLLTTEQVSDILQVHPFTVLKYIKQGKLKGIKLGRVWRIREKDVDNFIEERSNPGEKNEKKEVPEIVEEEMSIQIPTDEQEESDHYIIE